MTGQGAPVHATVVHPSPTVSCKISVSEERGTDQTNPSLKHSASCARRLIGGGERVAVETQRRLNACSLRTLNKQAFSEEVFKFGGSIRQELSASLLIPTMTAFCSDAILQTWILGSPSLCVSR